MSERGGDRKREGEMRIEEYRYFEGDILTLKGINTKCYYSVVHCPYV